MNEHPDRLRLREVASLAGISKRKVLDDVRRKNLAAVKLRCGTRYSWRVDRAEALRYLAELFHNN